MKSITKFSILFSLTILFGCDFEIKSGEQLNPEQQTQKVGNDTDIHGCKASAGYTWSQIKHNCIRLFEDGVRYNSENQNKNEAVLSAFVVKGKNDGYIELFLPEMKQSMLLSKLNSGNYSVDKYLVTDSTISIEEKIIYSIDQK